ncbi:MAG TPA: hypothetical protein DDY78_23835 [Planctomycetales bacterium]|nr:hypothetical protein [Planctomycetales bacterium]
MRYQINRRPGVADYLRNLSLTREGRIRLYVGLNEMAEFSDSFRADPLNRDGPVFFFRFMFEDAGRLRTLSLAVDDSAASYGVLELVYADLE